MRRMIFRRIYLLSRSERKARSITFSPNRTILIGPNGVGKSHLLKSLYWTFGAEPAAINPKWKKLHIASLVEFSLDEELFFAYRMGGLLAIFSSEGSLLKASNNISSDYGPYLSDLLGFNLILNSRDGKPVMAPPAFCFLPFYIDQDGSWQRAWSGFARLGQFKNPNKDVAYFHSGIRPREYYLAKSELEEKSIDVLGKNAELDLWRRTASKMDAEEAGQPVSFDLAEYQQDIDRLVREVNKLQKYNDEYKALYSGLANQRIVLERRISAAVHMLSKLEERFKLSISHKDHVECPTCGSVYDNSFIEQFRIFDDADACRAYLDEARQQVLELNKKQEGAKEKYLHGYKRAEALQDALRRKRNDIELHDIIRSEGRRQFRAMASKEMQELSSSIGSLEAEKKSLRRTMREYESKERKVEIEGFYLSEMQRNINVLNLNKLDRESYLAIEGKIKETGNMLPRALLAYYIAFYRTAYRHSTACVAPFIIDTPKQQDPDNANSRSIISLVVGGMPKRAQTILATTSMHGVDADAKYVELNEEEGLLQSDEYEYVSNVMSTFTDRLLQ